MPSMKYNGATIGGVADKAANIKYDNATSEIPSTNVQGAIDSIADDISSLNSTTISLQEKITNKFALVTGTTSSSTGAAIVQADYPQGFTINNCVVTSAMLFTSDGIWVTSPNGGQLRDGRITFYTDGSASTKSRPYKITLMRTDI